MNKEELASQLNGIEYPAHRSITGNIIEQAKAAGLVILYGASDDLMEFDGAFADEVGCYDGGEALIDKNGVLPEFESASEDEDECAKYFARKPGSKKVEALWCAEPGYSWTYKTDIPHATFEVVEDGEPYCRGIVFSVSDLA
ncbi:hypothetical protein ACYKDZ_13965 [Stutzerimonas stutzeri]